MPGALLAGFGPDSSSPPTVGSFAVTVDAARVASWLGENEEYDSWVRSLDAVVPTPVEALPGRPGPDAEEFLYSLGFTAEDAAETIAACPDPATDPELWWLLERSRQQLVNGIGHLDQDPEWQHPRLPESPSDSSSPSSSSAKARFFYVHVLLASFADTMAYHSQLGIDERISWATFADLGRQVAINRRIHGRGGLHVPGWFRLHARGLIYDLGRLQFNRAKQGQDFVLGTHIPESGPMAPEECDASFDRAARFFPTYFPDETYRQADCVSWLMDPQLADQLPADSNIVRFQRRFRLVEGSLREADRDIVEFVFRRDWDELIAREGLGVLPTDTRLQHAIVRHLRAGGHWRVGRGIRDFPAASGHSDEHR